MGPLAGLFVVFWLAQMIAIAIWWRSKPPKRWRGWFRHGMDSAVRATVVIAASFGTIVVVRHEEDLLGIGPAGLSLAVGLMIAWVIFGQDEESTPSARAQRPETRPEARTVSVPSPSPPQTADKQTPA